MNTLKEKEGLAAINHPDTMQDYLEQLIKQLKRNGRILLNIKVQTSASQTEIKGILLDGTLKINIAALPVKGRANQELIDFLASHFSAPKDMVKIVRGNKSKSKVVQIQTDATQEPKNL